MNIGTEGPYSIKADDAACATWGVYLDGRLVVSGLDLASASEAAHELNGAWLTLRPRGRELDDAAQAPVLWEGRP